MTLFNYNEEDIETLRTLYGERGNYLIIGKEHAPTTGKEHIHVYIEFHKQTYYQTLSKLFPQLSPSGIEHSRGSAAQTLDYISKEDPEPIILGTPKQQGKKQNKLILATEDPLADVELYPWQQELVNMIDTTPDPRQIHWYVDFEGAKGKTFLAKSLCMKDSSILYITGKAADMKYGIASYMISQEQSPTTILVDLSRSQENFVSYQGIEEIKNGIFYNTKYESSMCVFDIPHVIIFANFEPDQSKLSTDRWNIHTLGKDSVIQNLESNAGGPLVGPEPFPENAMNTDQLLKEMSYRVKNGKYVLE